MQNKFDFFNKMKVYCFENKSFTTDLSKIQAHQCKHEI